MIITILRTSAFKGLAYSLTGWLANGLFKDGKERKNWVKIVEKDEITGRVKWCRLGRSQNMLIQFYFLKSYLGLANIGNDKYIVIVAGEQLYRLT